MTIADVSHGLVRFYNDGPEFPSTPTLIEAEQAYRNQFAEAATTVVFLVISSKLCGWGSTATILALGQ